MADVYKGLTIEFGAETTSLGKALKDINSRARETGSELRKVDNALKFNPGNTVLLAQKQELLGKQISTTRDRLDALRKAQAKVEAMYASGEIDDGAYRAFQRDIIETDSKLKNLERQGKESNKHVKVKKDTVASFDKLKTAAVNVAVAIAASAAAGAASLVALTKSVMDNADEIQRQADVTGLSAERIQELQYVGNNLGVELDTMTGAQAKLTKTMAGARDGGEKQAKAFEKLGIKVTDSNGQLRDANTVMAEAFDKLGGVRNETERNAIAQQLFGKSAKDLNPLIRAGKDELGRLAEKARESGAVMSNEAVAGIDEFGDSLEGLKQSMLGGFGEIFAPFVPELQRGLDEIVNSPEFKDFIAEFQTLAQEYLPQLIDMGIEFAPIILPLMSEWLRMWVAMKPFVFYILGAMRNTATVLSTVITWMYKLGGAVARALMTPLEKFVAGLNKVISAMRKIPGMSGLQLITLNAGGRSTYGVTTGGSRFMEFASGGSLRPNRPQLVTVGDQTRGYEHILRDDQIVSLMKRAMGSGGNGVTQVFQVPVAGYSEVKRAARDAQEELAW